MPKFGFKCFIGSFIVSLAAVFAVTKTHSVISAEDRLEQPHYNDIEIKDINLFTQADPIENPSSEINSSQNEPLETLSVNNDVIFSEDDTSTDKKAKVSILYEPEEELSEENIVLADNNIVEDDSVILYSEDDSLTIDENSDDDTLSVDIVSENEFKPFKIPLIKNYKSNSIKDIEVSSEANKSQIALASASVDIDNLGAKQDSVAPLSNENNSYDSPWEVADASNKHIGKNSIREYAEKNTENVDALNKEKQSPAKSENETKVAYEMVQNLLIPIPEDIMKEKNLTPKLVYSKENKELNKKLQEQNILPKTEEDSESTLSSETENKPVSLTDSISAWFSNSEDKNEKDSISVENDKVEKTNTDNSSTFGKLLNLGKKKNSNIVPTELKLAFQPHRAEISGQTLEWLHAFSENAIKHEDVFIEIRINGDTAFELQQKRLNLLYTILANNGVAFNKINIIFADREPNSFIIRNVKYASEEAEKLRRNNYNPWY